MDNKTDRQYGIEPIISEVTSIIGRRYLEEYVVRFGDRLKVIEALFDDERIQTNANGDPNMEKA